MIAPASKEELAQTAILESRLPEKRRWTVAEYLKMAELGILSSNEKLELLDGEIYKKMSPVGLPHFWCVTRLTKIFERAIGDKVFVSVQNPLWLDDYNEPEPDVALLPLMETMTRPSGKDALLVVEVSDSSVKIDRTVKVPLYAKYEVVEVWLVDLGAKRVEVYREPKGEIYRQTFVFDETQSLSPIKFPSASFSVAEILGTKPLTSV